MKSRLLLLASGLLFSILFVGCSNRDEIARLSGEASQAETRGEHDVAIARWSSILKLDAKNRQALLGRAALYEATGKWQQAIADYTSYLVLPTNQPDVRPRPWEH